MSGAAHAQVIDVHFDEPTLDRWMYPFNATPGVRGVISTFGSRFDPDFDNRDAQMLVGFDTTADVEPELGADRYVIHSAVVTLMKDASNQYFYDDTQDPYQVFLDPEDPDWQEDADLGFPMELYGAGFRNDYDATTFPEDAPHAPVDPQQQQVRSAYAIDFDENGAPIDVSISVFERFDPNPWAMGIVDGLPPGDIVPVDSDIVFDIDVSNPDIQGYLKESLDMGMLDFCITSLHIVGEQEGSFPTIYTKENPLVVFDLASAARLDLVVEIVEARPPADLDGDGDVDSADLAILLSMWGPCSGCDADLDGDGDVDSADLAILLASWT